MWKSLGSVRLTIWLLSVIIVISFAGAVAPVNVQPVIFYSWWFLLVLAAFGLNLAACLSDRLLSSPGNHGSKVTHISILIILAGSLVSFLTASKGTIEFTRGEERAAFIGPSAMVPLGFTVRLEDFTVEWYTPQYFKLGVVVEDRGLRKKIDALPGREYHIDGSGYSFSIQRYFPQFIVDEQGHAANLSAKALNPALLVLIKAPSGAEEARWVFGRHPDISMGKDRNIRLVMLQQPLIREFRSRLRFSEGARSIVKDVKVNAPVSFGGYTFYQSGYDAQKPEWTALEVVRDRGAPIVFAGFALLNIGILMLYIRKWRAGRRREA